MSTQEVADQLVALCRQGKNTEAVKTLYADDIVSVEADGESREVKGLDAVIKKSEQFDQGFEVHSSEISEPLVYGNHFAIKYILDSTEKKSGQRTEMGEIAVYEVHDGKITREEFFYPKMG